jgi:hypothetical protein
MPKCLNCFKFFPPTYMVKKSIGGGVCMFCEVGKDFLTMTEENGNVYTVDKEYIVREYEVFMKKLLEKENVQNLIKNRENLELRGT